MGILAFILSGLVLGVVARAVMPGKEGMGLVPTELFALTGAFLGGLVGAVIYGKRVFEMATGGVLGSIVAVFLVLFLIGLRARSRRGPAF
jgi:uncharacterized membrane protein YeaQ/YmgE (transglycosylase-associated protein family)